MSEDLCEVEKSVYYYLITRVANLDIDSGTLNSTAFVDVWTY